MTFNIILTVDYPRMPVDDRIIKEAGGIFIKRPSKTEDELIAATKDADAVITMNQVFSKKIIDYLERCRIISSLGIAYNNIDVSAATQGGICVTNTPDFCLEEVSDHAMALLLACARKLVVFDNASKTGKWDSEQAPKIHALLSPMSRLRGQVVGLVGFKKIAKTLVPKVRGFGLNIIAYDPIVPDAEIKESGVEPVDFNRLLKESDYILLREIPTDSKTFHFFGEEQFKKMKPTAYFINTGRGTLVDEKALCMALIEKRLAGAGLDGLENEPPDPNNPLFKMDNVIISAHSAYYSEQSQIDIRQAPIENILQAIYGKFPSDCVNPEVKEKFIARWGSKYL